MLHVHVEAQLYQHCPASHKGVMYACGHKSMGYKQHHQLPNVSYHEAQQDSEGSEPAPPSADAPSSHEYEVCGMGGGR